MSYSYDLLNLRQVQYFIAAADAHSMTIAADRLSVSQSAVSLAIARLEDALGADLFIRQRGRGLTLTPAGQTLLRHVRDLLAHAEEIRAEAESLGRQLSGRLVVGCFRTAAPFVLPVLLETFERHHPDVVLDFIEGNQTELEDALLDGLCEIAILYDMSLSVELDRQRLYSAVPYVLIAPGHTLGSRDSLTLEELAPLDMILLDVPPTREHQLGIFHHAGLTPKVRYETSSYELLRSLVARNRGYAMLISRPHGDVSYEGRPLQAVRLLGDILPVDVVLAAPKGVRRTRRARAFAEHCHRLIGDNDAMVDGTTGPDAWRLRIAETAEERHVPSSDSLHPADRSA